MTRGELQALVDRVRRRHNRRVFIVLAALLGVFFGGVVLGQAIWPPSGPPARPLWLYGVLAAYFAVGVLGAAWIFRDAKADCYRLGVLCPYCRQHLYSRRRLLWGGYGTRTTGVCPHCGEQLIDELRAAPAASGHGKDA